jgi:hypothetical protein
MSDAGKIKAYLEGAFLRLDLTLTQAITGETAWVQIKSKANQADLNDYLGRFRREGSSDRFFFICHSAAGSLNLPSEARLHLWTAERVADAAIDIGLFNWLMERTKQIQMRMQS